MFAILTQKHWKLKQGNREAESNDLNYTKTHKSDLRSNFYSGLMDHLNQEAEITHQRVGHM